jgi:hypothetical protein
MSEAQSVMERPGPAPGVSALSRFLGVSAWTALAVTGAIAAGAVLRLIYPGVIEYHVDEQFSFEHVRRVLDGGAWPSFGMTMSIGGPNPGMSVWIFILLGYLFDPQTPPDLARAVQLMNIAAILAFAGFALVAIPRAKREPWLWAAALWSVNPLAVIYERKIWPPCTLPLFMVGMIAAWHWRRHWLGSFFFALIAVLGGQIHPTATFLGAVLFFWGVLGDWPRRRWRAFHLPALAAGGILGALPAVNWFLAYADAGGGKLNRMGAPQLTFYGRFLTEPFGFGADHVLGPNPFADFLHWPYWEKTPTWLGLHLHAFLALIAVGVFLAAGWRFLSRRRISLALFLVGGNEAGRMVRAVFFGFGAILTFLTTTGGGLYPHYLVVVTPIMMLWLVSLVAYADDGVLGVRGRAVLTAICVLDAAIAFAVLVYVHEVGDIYGEFGPSWEWRQMQHVPLWSR